MFITSPDNCVGIMVHHNSYVFMPLTVTGLINHDILETIKPCTGIWLDIFSGSCDTSANCLPINAEIFGNGRSADVFCHPCRRQVKGSSESGVMKSPWDSSNKNPMFGAADPLCISIKMNHYPSEIECAPAFRR